jgi:branched-chain amino acid transport system substrate-binding protein
MFRKRRAMLVVCMAVALVAMVVSLGCTPSPGRQAAGPKTLKIGIDVPLSGPVATWGIMKTNAVNMWVEEVNANGGLLVNGVRHPVEVYTCDNEAKPEKARTCAERLIGVDGVRFIAGPTIDTTCTAAGEVCNPYKVPHFQGTFDPKNVSPERPYSILHMWMAHQTAEKIYTYLRDAQGLKTIAFIQRDEPGCRAGLELNIQIAKDLGYEVLDTSWYAHGTMDMYPHATKVMAGNPDVIDSPMGSPEEMGLICKALRELGYTGVITTGTGGEASVTCAIAGEENCEGLIFNSGSFASDPEFQTPRFQEYIDRYVEKHGEWHTYVSSFLYFPQCMGACIQKAGTFEDPEAFMEEFHKLRLVNDYLTGDQTVTIVGLEVFGINNQIGVPLCIGRIHNGQTETITCIPAEPEPGITYDPPYQFKW